MCEIEHFVDPNDKNHPKFAKVRDYELTLFSACNQMDGRPAEVCTIGRAVDQVSDQLFFLRGFLSEFDCLESVIVELVAMF